jgi:hypothetical protein
MTRRLGSILLLPAAIAFGDTQFYSESWNSSNSNWTVAAGSPAYGGSRLRNSTSDWSLSRLVYVPSIPSNDYSIESYIYPGDATKAGTPRGWLSI